MGMEERPFRASGGWVMEYRQQIERVIADALERVDSGTEVPDCDQSWHELFAAAVFEALQLTHIPEIDYEGSVKPPGFYRLGCLEENK